MQAVYALIAVALVGVAGYLAGSEAGLRWAAGVLAPYAAIVIFLAGIAWRVARWALVPVPFRIPATGGQQKSLDWIKAAGIDNPWRTRGVIARMALEVLLFRSLFRNTRAELRSGPRMVFGESKFLWLGALAFHWSFLLIFLRHLRFFLDPVPRFVLVLQNMDGFFQIGAPGIYMTDLIVVAALLYLLQRRFADSQVRYISLFTDYFALFLLAGLALSGIWMRYFTKVDIVAIKQLAIGLVTFSPVVPAQVGPAFFLHLAMLSALLAYFPFSKLVHMGGIFLSPTRNLANNNRMKRHINPWNYPVKVHTYQEWEEEFHDKIVAAGLPLDQEVTKD